MVNAKQNYITRRDLDYWLETDILPEVMLQVRRGGNPTAVERSRKEGESELASSFYNPKDWSPKEYVYSLSPPLQALLRDLSYMYKAGKERLKLEGVLRGMFEDAWGRIGVLRFDSVKRTLYYKPSGRKGKEMKVDFTSPIDLLEKVVYALEVV